jgi:type IV pilus assembly protein PilM
MISWNFKSRDLSPIGLDIGHYSIKMIQLAVNNGRIAVVAAEEARVDANINGDEEKRKSFITSTLKKMLAEGKFRGKNVVSCLPSEKVRITSLRLSEMPPEQIEKALRKEAAHRFGLDLDKDAINYLPAGSVLHGDEVKSELILFATDDETIKDHIAMLEEAGLQPVAIDVIPCAFFRSFERSLRRQEDKERTVIFLDMGSRFTTVVFGRGGEICFVKQIAVGGARFNREIGARLGIDVNEVQMLRGKFRMAKNSSRTQRSSGEKQSEDDNERLDTSTRYIMLDAITTVAEELAKEISLCLRYYTVTFRGKRVEKVVFSGGEAYEGILVDVLKQQLRIEIEIAQPMKGFDLPSKMMNLNFDGDKQSLLSEWAVAVGLSLKGWNGITNEPTAASKIQENVLEHSNNYERD